MAFRELAARISADTGGYVTGLTTAINRTDEFDQQASQAARSVDRLGEDSTSTAARLNAFSASALGATTATRTLSTATTASLVPALATLSATAVPLTATLSGLGTAAGGVAAGFGAVTASGMYAYGQQVASSTEDAEGAMGGLEHALQPVREQLHETAMSMGQDFVPLIRDTIDALPQFIRNMEAAMGPLDPFAAALRDAGQAAFDLVPRLTEIAMNMAREMLPAVRDLGSAIANNAVPALQGVRDTTSEVVGMFSGMGSGLADLIPQLNEAGLTILNDLVPPLRDAASLIPNVVEGFNNLSASQQEFAARASVAAPAVGAVITRLTMISPLLGGVAAGVAGLGAAWATNFMGIREHTQAFIEEARPVFEDVMEVTTESFEEISAVTTEVMSAVEDQLAKLSQPINSLIREVQLFARDIIDAVETIVRSFRPTFDAIVRIFTENEAAIRGVVDSLLGAFEGLVNFWRTVMLPAVETVWTDGIAPIVNTVATTISDNIGPVLTEVGETITTLTDYATTFGNVMADVWDAVDQDVVPIMQTVGDIIDRTVVAAIETLSEGLKGVMNLVQGDFGAAWDNLTSLLDEGLAGALDILGIVKDGLISTAFWIKNNGFRIVTSIGESIAGLLVDSAFAFPGLVADAMIAVGDWIAGKTYQFFDWMVDLAGMVADAVINGIQSGLTSFADVPQVGPIAPPVGAVPGVQSGGFVEESGAAVIHEGEQIVPAEINREREVPKAGGGTVEVEIVHRLPQGQDALSQFVAEMSEAQILEAFGDVETRMQRLGER